jgi:tRNA pseudouridine55 synthase
MSAVTEGTPAANVISAQTGRGANAFGIIVLDKPTGLPSNRVLSQVKRLVGESKMGFLGTLDPLASGVLAVFVGKATRLIALFEGLSKTYRVTMKLGERTDTFDAEGQVLERRPLDGLTATQIEAAILAKSGRQQQVVPAFSAVKVSGVPAYKLARQGAAVPEKVREVELWDVAVESVALPLVVFRITCTAGTYVRSLVEALGRELGPGAHVAELRRLACGSLFTLGDSVTLEGIGDCRKTGSTGYLRNPAEYLPEHATLGVTPEQELQIRDGRTLPLESTALDVPGNSSGPDGVGPQGVKALRPDGTLIAVGQVVRTTEGALGFRPTRVLI